MFKEFKEFIARGNAIDLAIGVVMGAAFKSIVDSLVGDIIMPIVGFLTAGADFSKLAYQLKPAVIENGEVIKEAVNLRYGNLIQSVINFFVIALVLFMVVKTINRLRDTFDKKEIKKVEVKVSEDVVLLTEIRDLLKNHNN